MTWLAALTLALSMGPAFGQVNWSWLAGGGGDSVSIPGQFEVYNEVMSADLDDNGHLYITGTIAPPATIGGTSLPLYGHNDIFVARYDPAGNLIWARSAGGNASITTSNQEFGKAISVGTDGSAYIAGVTYNAAQFGNISVNAEPDPDGSFYIAKVSPAGDFQWVRDGEASDISEFDPNFSVFADDFDNVYLAAYTLNLKWLIDTFYAPPEIALYITQLDTAGNVNWNYFTKTGITVTLGSGYNNVDLTADGAGNVIYTASRPRLYQPSPSSNVYYPNLLLGKVDINGNMIWEKEFGDIMLDTWNGWATSVATSPNGDIYVGGYYLKDFILDPAVTATAGGFICRFDSQGNVIKAHAIPGNSKVADVTGVEWTPSGLMVSGNFFDVTDFGGVQLSPLSPPLFDMFVATYDTLLSLQQVTAYGYSRHDRLRTSSANTAGHYAVAGSYTDSLSMDNHFIMPGYVGPAAHAFLFAAASGTGTGLSSPHPVPEISVFPNPACDFINVEVSTQEPVTIMLLDAQGRKVTDPATLSGTGQFDTRELGPGYYMVFLSGNKWQHARRVTVIK